MGSNPSDGAARVGKPPPGQALSGLESLIAEAGKRGLPPVESWNPPDCGEIGMRIGADGTWYYQDSPIGRKRLVRLFSTVLRRDEDGRHYLVTPVEKIAITVDDAPFLAVEMFVEGVGQDQILTFRSNVDDVVRCDADHPMRFETEEPSGGLKPYLLVRGRLEALVTRSLYYDLVELAVWEGEGEDARFGFWSGDRFFQMAGKVDL